MSTAPGKAEPSQQGQSGSRTSSPMDAYNNPNDQSQNPADKNEAAPDNQLESKDKQSGGLENSRRVGQSSEGETGEYFNHFSLEPNPFEQSFGNPSEESSSKSVLPPVAAITSPALSGATSAPGFNWPNSLRAGPLSPAMLAGPAGSNEYFDNVGRGFPTPNESSLRTGLTPGGGGSMFPAPTPSGQASFPNLQSGGATPATLDFQRTAFNAAKKNGGPTSNPQESEQILQQGNLEASKSGAQMDPFAHPDATDAANSLFILSKGAQASSNTGQFAGPTSQHVPTQLRQELPKAESPLDDPAAIGAMSNDQGQSMSVDGDLSDGLGEQQVTRSNTRASRKKSNARGGNTGNARRKAEDTSKGPNKKLKSSSSNVAGDKSDSDNQASELPREASGNKKLTDEEKRKNFLERNRVAALKCRQRKKQWLTNLQNKVEMYSAENERLNNAVNELRREVVSLKTVLLAHKDCSVTHAQGINGMGSNGMTHEYPAMPPNPYSMSMQQHNSIPAQGMPRQ